MLKTHKGWVCLCDLGFHAVFSPWGSALPGVARQRTFLASPRKVSRRPQESLHTKVCHPSQAIASRRRKPTRYAKATLAGRTSACKRMPLRRHGTMFREFPASPQTCLRRCTRLTITCLGNARCGTSKTTALSITVTRVTHQGFAWCSTVQMPFVRDRKWKKKWVLSERSVAK